MEINLFYSRIVRWVFLSCRWPSHFFFPCTHASFPVGSAKSSHIILCWCIALHWIRHKNLFIRCSSVHSTAVCNTIYTWTITIRLLFKWNWFVLLEIRFLKTPKYAHPSNLLNLSLHWIFINCFCISLLIYRISSRTSLHIPTRALIFWINMVCSYGNDVTLKWNMPPN